MGFRAGFGVILAVAMATSAVAQTSSLDPNDPVIALEDGRTILRPGVLEGADFRDYTFTAAAGERVVIGLEAESPSAFFNLLPPGSETALHNGSIAGNAFDGALPQSGAWTVRLYLMGAARDEGRRVAYDLSVAKPVAETPDAVVGLAQDALAAIDGTPADGTAPASAIAPAVPGGIGASGSAGGVGLGGLAGPGSAGGILVSPIGSEATDAGPSPVGAGADSGSDATFEVANLSGSLNLRAEPATTAAVLATAPLGARLTNLGCEEAGGRTWCQVRTEDGTLAWGAQEFLVPAAADTLSLPAPANTASVGLGSAGTDALLPGPTVNAAGDLVCTVAGTSARCPFGVERGEAGAATIAVRLPDGSTRTIFVESGVPVASDMDAPFFMIRRDDSSVVTIGDAEVYEIPDAVAVGG